MNFRQYLIERYRFTTPLTWSLCSSQNDFKMIFSRISCSIRIVKHSSSHNEENEMGMNESGPNIAVVTELLELLDNFIVINNKNFDGFEECNVEKN